MSRNRPLLISSPMLDPPHVPDVTRGVVSWPVISDTISILAQSPNTRIAREPHAYDVCTSIRRNFVHVRVWHRTRNIMFNFMARFSDGIRFFRAATVARAPRTVAVLLRCYFPGRLHCRTRVDLSVIFLSTHARCNTHAVYDDDVPVFRAGGVHTRPACSVAYDTEYF